jgi:hypothetical protein
LEDPYWAPVAEKLTDVTKCLALPEGEFQEKQEHLRRPPLPDGTLGPICRVLKGRHTVKHDGLSIAVEEDIIQIVVPAQLIHSCMHCHHEQRGHPGRQRTQDTIKKQYFWIGMIYQIRQHVHECHYCKARKAHRREAVIPIQSYLMSERPWQRVHVDCATGLPITDGTLNTTVLVVKCALTKWVELVAMRDCSAQCVAEALVKIFARWGTPEYMVSDRGTEFTNSLLADILKLLATRHIRTTPVNPQSNGQAENHMRTFKDMLAAYIASDQRDWDKFLDQLQSYYNSTVNTTTGYSPFMLMTGREMNQSCNTHIAKVIHGQVALQSADEYVDKLTQVIHGLWESVTIKIDKRTAGYNKAVGADMSEDLKTYSPGDFVYRRRVPRRFYKDIKENVRYHINAKLQACRWTGPYRVILQLTPVLYIVDVHNSEKTLHIRHLKPAGRMSPKRRVASGERALRQQLRDLKVATAAPGVGVVVEGDDEEDSSDGEH